MPCATSVNKCLCVLIWLTPKLWKVNLLLDICLAVCVWNWCRGKILTVLHPEVTVQLMGVKVQELATCLVPKS